MSGTRKKDLSGQTSVPQKWLNDLRPGVDYVDPKYYLLQGTPDHLGRLELLKACERLQIPQEKWPPFENVTLPGPPEPLPGTLISAPKSMGAAVKGLVFQLPAFDLCADDHRSWKRKAEQSWRAFGREQFGPYLRQCTEARRRATQRGMLIARKGMRFSGAKREAIPLERRYELAAKRYCLGYSWAALQKSYGSVYRVDQVRKIVTQILSRLELRPRKLVSHRDT